MEPNTDNGWGPDDLSINKVLEYNKVKIINKVVNEIVNEVLNNEKNIKKKYE